MSTKAILMGLAGLLAVLVPGVAQGADPIVYYSFDELGTVVTDQSGHGYDGTPNGGLTFHDQGYLNSCFGFNGTNAYVQLRRPVQDNFTLTAWIKAEVPGRAGSQAYEGSGIVWSDVAGVANDFVVAALGTKLSFFCGNPDLSVNSKGDIVTGEWIHIAAVRDTGARTITVYIDGKLDSSVSHSNVGSLNAQAAFVVGGNTLDARYFNGWIDEVKIYDAALTAAEIKPMAPPKLKARKPGPADGAVGVVMPLLQWTKGETAVFHDVYLGTTPNLTAAHLIAPRQFLTMFYYAQGFTPGTIYYWRVDEIDATGTVHTGDVWSFVAQALTAYYPTPADGATGVATAPTLAWAPGQLAAKHHVYFGDSNDAVRQGAAGTDKGESTDPSFTPGVLESLTTYYWRVDETTVSGTVTPGPIWKLTTCLPVDDFESYTDDQGSRIYETWIDGWTNGTGSTVGYTQTPFAERTMIHSGRQAMPLDYNNLKSPFYSETERQFASVQDWTVNGADTLVLYLRGRAGNASAPVYVALEDTSQHLGTVPHPDPTVTQVVRWTEWKIPLSSFAGVNLAKVKNLYLGVGNRQNPSASGAGRLYLDDIHVLRP
ncbi:MAG: LamG domain-containing protein [Planctomycetes bacterium]|nr:LamG domain-containing protein [Planctomycetota bacterium]